MVPGQVSWPGVSSEWKGPVLLTQRLPVILDDSKMSDMKDVQLIYNCENSSEEIPFQQCVELLGQNIFYHNKIVVTRECSMEKSPSQVSTIIVLAL